MVMELGDSCSIKCPKNGFVCELNFKTKVLFIMIYNRNRESFFICIYIKMYSFFFSFLLPLFFRAFLQANIMPSLVKSKMRQQVKC